MLQDGEAENVCLADMQKLASQTNQQNPDLIIRCAFVAGLPTETSIHLKSLAGLDKMPLLDIFVKSRAMLVAKTVMTLYSCATMPKAQGR